MPSELHEPGEVGIREGTKEGCGDLLLIKTQVFVFALVAMSPEETTMIAR